MSDSSRESATKARKARSPLGREAWLDAARCALIEDGTAGVEINKLAKRLGVSRGGFYWFFKSRQQLLDELLGLWAREGTVVFERVMRSSSDGVRQIHALSRLWIDESEYDPRWDGAVRDWARTSAAVFKVVASVDRKRVAIIRKMFVNLGYRGRVAEIRARVTYYHQVGYYALGIRESRKRRLELLPFYVRVLAGARAKFVPAAGLANDAG